MTRRQSCRMRRTAYPWMFLGSSLGLAGAACGSLVDLDGAAFDLVSVNSSSLPASVATGVDQLGPFDYQVVAATITLFGMTDSISRGATGRFEYAYTVREIRGTLTADSRAAESGSFAILTDSLVRLTYSDGRGDIGTAGQLDSTLTFVTAGPPGITYVFRRR